MGSFGEALIEHPLQAAEMVLGAGVVLASAGGEVAGVSLDITGVGTAVGIPVGGLSTAGFFAGYGLIAAGGTVIAQAAIDDFAADSAGSAAGSPPADPPYVNHNPRATPTETAAGELLNREAHAGRLPGIANVEGAAEVPGTRSGDYRAIAPDGTASPVDHYEPRTGSTPNIETHVEEKSGQAETVVVEFGQGGRAGMGVEEAARISENVLSTPGHGVRRLIFIKDGRSFSIDPRQLEPTAYAAPHVSGGTHLQPFGHPVPVRIPPRPRGPAGTAL